MAKLKSIQSSTDNDIATLEMSLRELESQIEEFKKKNDLLLDEINSKKLKFKLFVPDKEKVSDEGRKKIQSNILEVSFK
jgi:hypothetical protein